MEGTQRFDVPILSLGPEDWESGKDSGVPTNFVKEFVLSQVDHFFLRRTGSSKQRDGGGLYEHLP